MFGFFRMPALFISTFVGCIFDMGCVMSCYYMIFSLLYILILKDCIEIFAYSSVKLSKRIIWILQIVGVIERQTASNSPFSLTEEHKNAAMSTESLRISPISTQDVSYALSKQSTELLPLFLSPICRINVPQSTILEIVKENGAELSPEEKSFLKRKWKTLKLKYSEKEFSAQMESFPKSSNSVGLKKDERKGKPTKLFVQEESPSTICCNNLFFRLKSKFNKDAPSVSYKRL